MIIGRLPFYRLWKNKYATRLKRRRFEKIMQLVELPQDRRVKVLEVGCANGKDFIQFIDRERFDVWGADIAENEQIKKEVHFVQADAENLPFADNNFDLVVSIGLLEHIEPMEKLCRVIREFERVGKHQISVVPSIATIMEPHSFQWFFPLRLHRELRAAQAGMPLHLNFFTEHTWTKFIGFYECNIRRFFYLPPFVRNTVIYK